MQPYQNRVLMEMVEIDNRTERLKAFMQGETFRSLDRAEQGRMRRQFEAMTEYAAALRERVYAFAPSEMAEGTDHRAEEPYKWTNLGCATGVSPVGRYADAPQQPASPDRVIPQVPSAMKRLEQIVGELEASINHLENRLASALNPGANSESMATTGGPADIRAPLADQIQTIGSKIVYQYQRIHDLTNRLELE